MTVLATLCANIRRLRLARGWSQESTAEKAGSPPRHYQDVEAGRRPSIRSATIEKVAKALRVQVWELLQAGRFLEPERQRGRAPERGHIEV